MNFKKQIFFLVSLFFVQFVIAQGGATIKAFVDKNKILIGEPLQLTVEANFCPECVISFVSIDSISHFEFTDKPVVDTVNSKGVITIRGVYKITSFDSGHWVIPSFVLSPAVKTDTIPIDVVFSDFDANQDYHDIKDILEVEPSKRKTAWWWYVAAGALLLGLLMMYLLRKKKPVQKAIPKAVINPFEEAMKQLEQLERDKPEPRQYHSKLTDIFRLYIFRKKGILSLQKTTTDLVLQLRNLDLQKEQFDKLSQSLRLSDFVKFAKYIPSTQDDKNCFEEIKNSIVIIEKTEAKAPPEFTEG